MIPFPREVAQLLSTAGPYPDGSKGAHLRGLEDLRERRHPDRAIETDTDPVEEVLWDVAAALIAVETPDEAFAALAGTVSCLVPVHSLAIMDLDADSGRLITVHAAGADGLDPEATLLDLRDSLAGRVALTGEAIWNNEVVMPPSAQEEEGEGESGLLASISVPLDAGHGPIGVLDVMRFGPDRDFDSREFEILCQIGRLTALVLDKAHRTKSLQLAAETDQLTDLPNRRSFIAELSAAMNLAREEGSDLSLLAFDVDNFKAINDTYGHGVGDEILRSIASVARQASRDGDMACRTGGEEFSILLPGASRSAGHRVGERLMRLLASRTFPPVGKVSVSAGVAQWDNVVGPEDLMRAADDHLYSAKRAGKARVVS